MLLSEFMIYFYCNVLILLMKIKAGLRVIRALRKLGQANSLKTVRFFRSLIANKCVIIYAAQGLLFLCGAYNIPDKFG